MTPRCIPCSEQETLVSWKETIMIASNYLKHCEKRHANSVNSETVNTFLFSGNVVTNNRTHVHLPPCDYISWSSFENSIIRVELHQVLKSPGHLSADQKRKID